MCRPVYKQFFFSSGYGLHVEHLDEQNAKPNRPLPAEERSLELWHHRHQSPHVAVERPPTPPLASGCRPRATLISSVQRFPRARPAERRSAGGKLPRIRHVVPIPCSHEPGTDLALGPTSTTESHMTTTPESSNSAETADEQWLTPKDICTQLQITEKTFYQWRVKHLGPRAYRIGRHLRISRTDYDSWLSSRLEA